MPKEIAIVLHTHPSLVNVTFLYLKLRSHSRHCLAVCLGANSEPKVTHTSSSWSLLSESPFPPRSWLAPSRFRPHDKLDLDWLALLLHLVDLWVQPHHPHCSLVGPALPARNGLHCKGYSRCHDGRRRSSGYHKPLPSGLNSALRALARTRTKGERLQRLSTGSKRSLRLPWQGRHGVQD